MCIDDMLKQMEDYKKKYGGSTEVTTRSMFGGFVEAQAVLVSMPRGGIKVVIVPKD